MQFSPLAPPASAEMIDVLQERCAVVLPPAYRSFLERQNGGSPEPCGLTVPGWHGGTTAVAWLYAVGEGQQYDLEQNILARQEVLPHGFVAIGEDSGGNVLCLLIEGDEAGSVWFWDHEEAADGESLFNVADDIEAFLGKLYDPDQA